MLVIDVSNLAHTAMSSGQINNSNSPIGGLRVIPYIFNKIAIESRVNNNVLLVFDPEKEARSAGNRLFQTKRPHTPEVEWELNVLKKLAIKFGIPYLQDARMSADSLIYSYCTDNYDLRDNIFILSADADIMCNVRDRGDYTTTIKTFSKNSKTVTVDNFTIETGVPFNFMTIDKVFCGCSSDAIPPMENGKELREEYYNFLTCKILGQVEDEDLSIDNFDSVYDSYFYNKEETIKEWAIEYMNNEQLFIDMADRLKAVLPSYKSVGTVQKINWKMFNAISEYLFRHAKYQNIQETKLDLSEEQETFIDETIANTPLVKSTVFNTSSAGISSSDIENINLEDLMNIGGESL